MIRPRTGHRLAFTVFAAALLALLPCALHAAASRELQFGMLPFDAPLSDADFHPDTRTAHLAIQQLIADPPPRAGFPGYRLHATAVELGVMRALGFADDSSASPDPAGPARPTRGSSLWPRLAIEGHATVGGIYGRSHRGGWQAGGIFGNLAGDFGLQLLTAPAGSLRQLCGIFGIGLDYTYVSIKGPGSDADVVNNFSYLEAGLQAAFALNSAWQLQPFLMSRFGITGVAVHQSDRLRERYTGFYRVWTGADLSWRYDPAEQGNQFAAQAAIAYADNTRVALTLTLAVRHAF